MRKGLKKAETLGVVLFLAMAVLAGCGGGDPFTSSDDTEQNEGSARDQQAVLDVEVTGGEVELPGIVKVVVAPQTFDNSVIVTLGVAEMDESNLNDYTISGEMFDASFSSNQLIKIHIPAQPKKAIQVYCTVPDIFMSNLGPDLRPKLFVKYFEEGADDEKHDIFEINNASASNGVITAILPPEAFTNMRETGGVFESIIVLGSIPTIREQIVRNERSFRNEKASSNVCAGRTVRSPLNGNLEARSLFGQRIHPIDGTSKPHYGVDLRAFTGDSVMAVAGGLVDRIGYNYDAGRGVGYGRYVVLLHADGSKTRYAHLEDGSTDNLHVGDSVSAGTIIGRADSTGGVTGPHLHFELAPYGDIDGETGRVDPLPCIRLPVTIVSVTVDDALFHPVYGVPFEINLRMPENNYVARYECLIDGGSESEYFCRASSPCSIFDYDGSPDRIQGCISFSEPRGTAAATYRITDQYGNVSTAAISVSWDCCDDTSEAFYLGMPLSCFTLGDMSSQCH